MPGGCCRLLFQVVLMLIGIQETDLAQLERKFLVLFLKKLLHFVILVLWVRVGPSHCESMSVTF